MDIGPNTNKKPETKLINNIKFGFLSFFNTVNRELYADLEYIYIVFTYTSYSESFVARDRVRDREREFFLV
jgi:hypothetical protein